MPEFTLHFSSNNTSKQSQTYEKEAPSSQPPKNNAPTTDTDGSSLPQAWARHLDYITQCQVSGRHFLELWRSKEHQALVDPCMGEARALRQKFTLQFV